MCVCSCCLEARIDFCCTITWLLAAVVLVSFFALSVSRSLSSPDKECWLISRSCLTLSFFFLHPFFVSYSFSHCLSLAHTHAHICLSVGKTQRNGYNHCKPPSTLSTLKATKQHKTKNHCQQHTNIHARETNKRQKKIPQMLLVLLVGWLGQSSCSKRHSWQPTGRLLRRKR